MTGSETSPVGLRLDRTAGRSVFGADAAGYDSARLGYPVELYDRIFGRVPDNPAVLEIGAGTGLATRGLLAREPSSLVAVEPDRQMAEFLRTALGAHPALKIENRAFEDVALSPATFDLVAAAASFHWMEPARALARIRAALKPGGVIALWWNVYGAAGEGDEFADALAPLLEGIALPPSEGEKSHHSLDQAAYRVLLESNGFAHVECEVLRRERRLDAREMCALYDSYSFVRLLPAPQRRELLDRIAQLVDERFGGGALNVVRTPLYTAALSDRHP
ncbi:MAG: class I SAM-dependent methyltransferase [Qipengyuania sp.]|jgi:SAM-dependent methyltransferase|nr:class I SAM-dependent methyltransferase [Qipengyuania sp.]